MNQKKWYWIIGIAVVVVAAALIWGASASREAPQTPPGSASGDSAAGSGEMDHSAMDHGQPGESSGDPSLRGYLEDQDALMSAMMEGMEGIERSGSAAIDFLAGMIPHHEAAVAMAESYLNHGGAQEVLAPLARDVITAQKAEIEQMQTMIAELKERGALDEEQADAYLEAYDKLMDHSMSHSAAADIDAAFAEGMMMHHQMAVDMANAILPHTDDEDVKQLAQTIIDTQQQEIAQMQAVLDGLGQA